MQEAYRAWSSAAALRARRDRYKRYTYGDQWSDTVSDQNGRLWREEDLIVASGRKPLKSNLIRQLVKTVVGRFRTICAEQGIYETDAIADIAARNSLAELDSRALEEFLISGCAVQRVERTDRFGKEDVWIENVDIRNFFTNSFRDPRGWDIDMAGMLHDMTFSEIVRRFSCGKSAAADKLAKLFADADRTGLFAAEAIGEPGADPDFFCSMRDGRFRVIEIWTLEGRRRRRADRISIYNVWHCRWLAPDGTLLAEYDSPSKHGSHPFEVKYYPLTDGEVHSFVEDIVDQQRTINRLVVLLEHVLSCSAKGVLLFPVTQKPENFSWDDVSRNWAQPDGIIPINGMGNMPVQMTAAGSDTGIYRLLEMQMKLFDDVSGVGDVLTGRSGGNARGADMLDTQVRNATAALADIFQTFMAFTASRDKRAVAA